MPRLSYDEYNGENMADNWKYINKLIDLGDKEGAANELIKIVDSDPSQVEAWLMLAELTDNHSEKADCYRKVLQHDVNNTVASDGLKNVLSARQATDMKSEGAPLHSAPKNTTENTNKAQEALSEPNPHSILVSSEVEEPDLAGPIMSAIFGVAVMFIAFSFISISDF